MGLGSQAWLLFMPCRQIQQLVTSSVACSHALKHRLKRSGHAHTKLDIKSEIAVYDMATSFLADVISPGFPPAASWEVLINVDASTDFRAEVSTYYRLPTSSMSGLQLKGMTPFTTVTNLFVNRLASLNYKPST